MTEDLRRIIWIASFPKSGNTWVRGALGNYFQPPGQSLNINRLRDFATADVRQSLFDRANGRPFRGRTIEDWMRVRPEAMRLIAASKPGHNFVKTHCQVIRFQGQPLIPPEVTAGAIYLVRNPFDVALSYARHIGVDADAAIGHTADRNATQGSASGILEVVGRWDDHVRTWITAPGLTLHLMRYEDMVADSALAFRNLLAFLGVPVDDAKLQHTLKATSFEAMQKQERETGFHERPSKMEQFFATGTAGGWRDKLTPAQVARIRAAFLPALEKWYPEMLDETARIAEGAA